MDRLIISPSPHIHSGDSVERNMYAVLIALAPACLVSLVTFGLGAFIVLAVSVLACVLTEWVITKYLYKQPSTIGDGSAILTGLLLGMNLPSSLPWWIIVIGAIVAIGVGKMSFGGLGGNIFNPALVGRVFLLIRLSRTDDAVAQGRAVPQLYRRRHERHAPRHRQGHTGWHAWHELGSDTCDLRPALRHPRR